MKPAIGRWLGALPFLLVGCHYPGTHTPVLAPPPPEPGLSQLDLTNGFDPNWLKASTEPFTLGPGDKLEIEVLGETTSRNTTVVAPDGKIYFNLLPGIDVWGLTLAQAKQRLESELGKYVRQQPQVSMVLRGVESKRVWVLGRVQAPGVYPVATPMTLLEAISTAGGTLGLSF